MDNLDKYVTIFQENDKDLKIRARHQPIYDSNPKITENDKSWMKVIYDNCLPDKIRQIKRTTVTTYDLISLDRRCNDVALEVSESARFKFNSKNYAV